MKKQICRICKEEKILSEFYKSNKHLSGYDNRCKECNKERQRKEYHADLKENRKKSRERAQKTYYRNLDKTRERIRKNNKIWRKRHPEEKAQERIKYREKYPNRFKANQVVRNAIRNGTLIKPELCEDCDEKKAIYAHHHSYKRRFWLDVKWLCTICHPKYLAP